MAGLIAVALRDLARETMLGAGGRGFMRFAEDGSALLVTDAIRRCEDAEALTCALEGAGFRCMRQEGLLFLFPGEALLRRHICLNKPLQICWEESIHPVQALAARWLAAPENAFTQQGQQLVLNALRLTGMPGKNVLRDVQALGAHAAVMLRMQDRSGMREAGAILANWCEYQIKHNDRRRTE